MPLPTVECFRGLNVIDQLAAIYEATLQIGGVTPPPAYDPNAQAFFDITGLSDVAQKDAINQLVLDLKAANIWTKMLALWPFVGGTAEMHSYNLIDPQVYQQNWAGGVIHSVAGVQGDAATAFGDGNFIPDGSGMTVEDAGYSVHLNLPGGSNQCQMGTPSAAADPDVFQFFNNLGGNTYFFGAFGTNTGKISGSNADGTTGFFTGSRTAANSLVLYRNGVAVLSGSGASEGGLPSQVTYILGRNDNGNLNAPTDARQALAAFHLGLSAAEALAFNNADQAYQTALGRV